MWVERCWNARSSLRATFGPGTVLVRFEAGDLLAKCTQTGGSVMGCNYFFYFKKRNCSFYRCIGRIDESMVNGGNGELTHRTLDQCNALDKGEQMFRILKGSALDRVLIKDNVAIQIQYWRQNCWLPRRVMVRVLFLQLPHVLSWFYCGFDISNSGKMYIQRVVHLIVGIRVPPWWPHIKGTGKNVTLVKNLCCRRFLLLVFCLVYFSFYFFSKKGIWLHWRNKSDM